MNNNILCKAIFCLSLFWLINAYATDQPSTIEEFEIEVSRLHGQELSDWIVQYAKAHPNNPIIEENRALLLFDPSSEGQSIQGDFNSWGRYQPTDTTKNQSPMHARSVGDTGWRYLITTAQNDARLQYALADSEGKLARDPRNKSVALSFGLTVSEIIMPGFRSTLTHLPAATASGKLETFDLIAPFDQKSRKIQVYLPPGYHPNGTSSYPSIWFNDGSAYLTKMNLKSILDSMISGDMIKPLIGVFVDPQNRREDYRRSESFRRFIGEIAIPFVNDRYQVENSASSRTIIGSSRGALAALDLSMQEPVLFMQAALLTPALSPTAILSEYYDQGGTEVSYYVVGGLYDQRFVGDYFNLIDTLQASGTKLSSGTFPEGHNQVAWRRQLPDIFLYFFGHPHKN